MLPRRNTLGVFLLIRACTGEQTKRGLPRPNLFYGGLELRSFLFLARRNDTLNTILPIRTLQFVCKVNILEHTRISTTMTSSQEPISVLFVCLGNICRSTMAEGIFRSIVSKTPYQSLVTVVDSCGTGAYHTGNSPDSRTMSTLEDNGITDYRHAARKVEFSPLLQQRSCHKR